MPNNTKRLLTVEEIAARVAQAFGLSIQDPIDGVIATGSDGSNPAAQPFAVPVKIKGQEETYEARYNPLIDATVLTQGMPVKLKRNRGGELEVEDIDARQARIAYGTTQPTRNFLFMIHNHEGETGGGYLNASNVFNAGTTPLQYGGSNADLSGLTTGALIAKGASALGAANLASGSLVVGAGTGAPTGLAPGSSGNYVRSNGSVWQATGLNVSDAASGTLAVGRGGTGSALTSTGPGHLIQASVGSVLTVVLDKFAATTAPTINDDSGDGYAIGSVWYDTANDNIYICMDATLGAALWRQINNSAISSPWQTTSNVVNLVTSTDSVSIGTSAGGAKLYIDGDADEEQFHLKGHSTQSNLLVFIEQDGGTILFTIANSGKVFVGGELEIDGAFNHDGSTFGVFSTTPATQQAQTIDLKEVLIAYGFYASSGSPTPLSLDGGDLNTGNAGIDGTLTVNDSGADADWRFEGDNDPNLFFGDASTNRVAIGTTTPQGRLDITGRANENQLYIKGFTGQSAALTVWADDTGTNLILFGALGSATFNSNLNDADFLIKGDTDATLFFADASADAIQIGGNAPTAWLHLKAPTTAKASARFPAGSAPTSPNDGDVWADSSFANGLYNRAGGMTGSVIERIYGQYSEVGNSNTTSVINLIGGSGRGTATIASAKWFAGQHLRFKTQGWASTGGVARNLTILLKLGSTTLVSDTVSVTLATAGRFWYLDVGVTCYSTGSSGTVSAQGFCWVNATQFPLMFNTTTTTLNTTTSQAAQITGQFGTADGNTQIQADIVEIWAAA